MNDRSSNRQGALARKVQDRKIAEVQERHRAEVDEKIRSLIEERGHKLSRKTNRQWATYECTVCGGLVGIYRGNKPILRLSPRLEVNCHPELTASTKMKPRDLREFGL